MWFTRRKAIAGLLLAVPGCGLFRSAQESGVLDGAGVRGGAGNGKGSSDGEVKGAQIRTARLEALIVSRPAEDARLRRLVWEELDESGLMSPEQRQKLNLAGVRIGVAGSGSPWALQSLAREAAAAEQLDADGMSRNETQASHLGVAQGFSLMPKGQSFLELQSGLEERGLPLSRIPQLSALRDRSQLRCVMEVTAREIEKDWVLLNFLPVVHAGAATQRLTIEDFAEKLPIRQNVVPLYEYQVDVRLMTEEVAVLGRYGGSEGGEWTLGNLFFQPERTGATFERLLMVRMAGIEVLEGRSDPGFRLGAYDRK